jgi:hypothetical protein
MLAGPVYDRGHLHLLLLVGSFMIALGHMMLSLCNTFWQVVLAQSVCDDCHLMRLVT